MTCVKAQATPFVFGLATLVVSFPVFAQPVIASLEGNFEESDSIVVHGSGFTSKANAKPLFWWTADGGERASDAGRTGWVDANSGEPSRAIVAPGSSYAWRYNHGAASGAALGRVYFDSNEVYIWRKKYDDFDITNNMVPYGSDGSTFNYKTIRFWYEKKGNNLHVNAQGRDGLSYRMTPEYTDATQWGTGKSQQPFRWVIEQYIHKAGTIDQYDGVFQFAFDNDWTNLKPIRNIRTTTKATDPTHNRYTNVVMSQVSNGATNPSFVYYDSLYIDDSWHRVLVSTGSTYGEADDAEVQLPIAWSDSRIEFVPRLGSLDSSYPLYLYIVDSRNRVNSVGVPISCVKCAVPPSPVAVE